VLFRYEFKGIAHASSRYGLGSGSGLYATADSIVQSLKASPQTTCYVNPADPDDALLNRDLAGSMAFWMLFPVAFIGMPGLGLYGYVRNSRQKKARLAARHKHEQS
jgi:hypothetical protein